MSVTLEIRNHTEACIISNAVREHCRQEADKFHAAMCDALRRGDKAEADRLQRHRDELTQAEIYYTDHRCGQLAKVMERFESMMDWEQDAGETEPGHSGITYAGYGANSHAPCGN